MVNLNRLVAKWQKILRLQDWDVNTEYSRERDFTNKQALGECSFSLPVKED